MKSKMVSNVVILLAVGIVFPGFLGLRESNDLAHNVVGLLTAQFSFAAFAAILNPFSAVAGLWVFTAVVMQDSAKGTTLLATKSPLFKRLFGTLSLPLLGMAIAAGAALVIQTINSNIWSLISLFAMAQVLLFLGVRALRDAKSKGSPAQP